jgi:hypothetical protein
LREQALSLVGAGVPRDRARKVALAEAHHLVETLKALKAQNPDWR